LKLHTGSAESIMVFIPCSASDPHNKQPQQNESYTNMSTTTISKS